MYRYAFVLGHRPLLSLAEVTVVLKKQAGFKPVRFGNGILVVELSAPLLQPQEWLNKLGGTIKIALLTNESFSPLTSARKIIGQEITADNLAKLYLAQTQQKVEFGFSVYPLASQYSAKDLQVFLRTYGIDLKQALRRQNISSRLVVSNEAQLSSVVVAKNRLLTRGAEIDVIFDDHYLALGKTIAIQDFEDYGLRDYGRPEADPKKGMLPPKLAQILINLAEVEPANIIFDPFCGLGTILQEALLRGYKVIGTDASEETIRLAKKNIKWLIDTYKLTPANVLALQAVDVHFLGQHFHPGTADAIVTEGLLGPALSRAPGMNLRAKYFGQLSRLYLKAFEQYRKTLAPGGRVVTALPYYISPDGHRDFLPILDNIKQLGYTQIRLFSPDLEKTLNLKPDPRGTLLYERPRQIVGREIAVFEK